MFIFSSAVIMDHRSVDTSYMPPSAPLARRHRTTSSGSKLSSFFGFGLDKKKSIEDNSEKLNSDISQLMSGLDDLAITRFFS